MSRVAIIDHGLGNLQAVEKALLRAGGDSTIFRCYEPDALRRADAVVLPGMGRLDACVEELARIGMAELLPELVREKPLLAISTGMHALGRDGLGLVDFHTRPLDAEGNGELRLPHMGWNRVHALHSHPLWEGIPQDAWFWFAHRDRVDGAGETTVATTEYGGRIPAVLAAGRVVGVQFHPEISHDNGLRFLANFVNWDSRSASAEDVA